MMLQRRSNVLSLSQSAIEMPGEKEDSIAEAQTLNVHGSYLL